MTLFLDQKKVQKRENRHKNAQKGYNGEPVMLKTNFFHYFHNSGSRVCTYFLRFCVDFRVFGLIFGTKKGSSLDPKMPIRRMNGVSAPSEILPNLKCS